MKLLFWMTWKYFGFLVSELQSVSGDYRLFLEFWWEIIWSFSFYLSWVSLMLMFAVREGYGIIWQSNASIRLQRCSHWESWQDKLNIKREIKFLTILRERSDDNNAEGSSQSQQSHRFFSILFFSIFFNQSVSQTGQSKALESLTHYLLSDVMWWASQHQSVG